MSKPRIYRNAQGEVVVRTGIVDDQGAGFTNSNPLDVRVTNSGPFNHILNAQPFSLIELSGIYPLSTLRDLQRASGTGAISDTANGEYRVHHATGGDTASLISARHGRYVPGYGAETGLGLRIDGDLTDASSFAEWGYFTEDSNGDVDDGFLFGLDADGMYIRVVKAGSDQINVRQASWNQSTTLDPTDGKGRVYQIRFSYYGYGLAIFSVVEAASGDERQETRLLHTYAPAAGTSLSNINLQVGARVGSTSGTDDFSAYVGGRKYHILGDYAPSVRTATETAIDVSTSTTVIPIVSFRRKSGRNETTISPDSLTVLAASADAILSIRINSTLTGASFGTLTGTDDTETALEVDTTATAVNTATGIKIFETLVGSGQGGSSGSVNVRRLLTEIPDDAVVSFCARTTTGSGSVSMTARMIEEW